MSDQAKGAGQAGKVQAHILRAIRVAPMRKRVNIAALEMRTEKGAAFFLVTRETLLQMAEYLRKNAERIPTGTPSAETTESG